jgi:type II secretory pathway pseudopilin PulG
MDIKDFPRHQNEGFTLVEILIMMVILSFVALGIAGLFSHAMLTNASGHDYALLASEARFALEEMQARPFEDAVLTETPPGDTLSWAPVNPNFAIEYTVEDYRVENWTEAETGSQGWTDPVGSEVANLKRITMTVTSTNEILRGRRVLTVTCLKIPG